QSTTYKLVVEPWGNVYVDGDERGVSPPLKRLTLAPGLHTIRIVNPNYQDHVVKVEAGKAATGRIAHDFNDE
ncbi:MAG TPA: PEGA domain-containing protein, partial [Telluria sp.]|nr:PEGA domain-containing protein [Telluria sp.]